ncbi:MAG: 4Fe-4S binding protein [Methanomassiliicoccales archaeon]
MGLKNQIKQFALGLGVDDIGFASISDYQSPKSPPLESIFPGARSMIIMVNREPSHCESPNPQIATTGRMELLEYNHQCNLQLARYLERHCSAKAMVIPPSYPLNFGPPGMGMIGEVSLRHAAIAAGLGRFGRHNLVIHPRLGTRVFFCGVLCDLDLPSDPPVEEDLCCQCNLCVENCPTQALDEEGLTNTGRCFMNVQPNALPKLIKFWRKFVDANPDEQKKMFLGEDFAKAYHAQLVGFEYHCFKCYTSCPISQ